MFRKKRRIATSNLAQEKNPRDFASHLESLPDETLVTIASHLGTHSLFNSLRPVNNRFKRICDYVQEKKSSPLENNIRTLLSTLYRDVVQPQSKNKNLINRTNNLKAMVKALMSSDCYTHLYGFMYQIFFKDMVDTFSIKDSSFTSWFERHINEYESVMASLQRAHRRGLKEKRYHQVDSMAEKTIEQLLYKSSMVRKKRVNITLSLLLYFQYELKCMNASDNNKRYKEAIATACDTILNLLNQDELAQYRDELTATAHTLSLNPCIQGILQDATISQGAHPMKMWKAKKIALQADKMLLAIFSELSQLITEKMQNSLNHTF